MVSFRFLPCRACPGVLRHFLHCKRFIWAGGEKFPWCPWKIGEKSRALSFHTPQWLFLFSHLCYWGALGGLCPQSAGLSLLRLEASPTPSPLQPLVTSSADSYWVPGQAALTWSTEVPLWGTQLLYSGLVGSREMLGRSKKISEHQSWDLGERKVWLPLDMTVSKTWATLKQMPVQCCA